MVGPEGRAGAGEAFWAHFVESHASRQGLSCVDKGKPRYFCSKDDYVAVVSLPVHQTEGEEAQDLVRRALGGQLREWLVFALQCTK